MTNAQVLDNLIKVAFIPNPQFAEQDSSQQGAPGQDPTQQQGGAPGGGDPAQMAQMMQQMQQGGAPGQDQGQPTGIPPEAMADPAGHVNAEGSLDNTQVTLSVKELLDLVSGGKASVSLNKVKLEAISHNKKIEQMDQKTQQEQAQQEQEAQMQAQQQAQDQSGMMQQGGIYPGAPMGAQPGQATPPMQ